MSSAAHFHTLISEFPCLIPTDASFSAYAGFITVSNRQFRVRIAADCTRFDADPTLTRLLRSAHPSLPDRLRAATTPHAYLVDVRHLVEHTLSTSSSSITHPTSTSNIIPTPSAVIPVTPPNAPDHHDLPDSTYYDALLADLSRLGWHHVCALDRRLRTVSLKHIDAAGRTHTADVVLPSIYPRGVARVTAALPDGTDISWRKDGFCGVASQLQQAVDTLQPLFDALDDFDAHTWVLEPPRPTRRDTYRRVALGRHASMRVTLDPRAPVTGVPDCRLLGSEAAVAPFKQRLNEKIHLWDMSGDTLPRANLELVLDERFPRREMNASQEEQEEMAGECGICYTYRLQSTDGMDGCAPDVACDREECCRPYHRECLVQWFRALPDTRESFGTLTGACVYCEHVLSVSVKGD